jgi:hypothetical protein
MQGKVPRHIPSWESEPEVADTHRIRLDAASVLPVILHDGWISQVLLHGFKIIVIDEHEASLRRHRLLAQRLQVVAGVSVSIPREWISLKALVPLGVIDRQG